MVPKMNATEIPTSSSQQQSNPFPPHWHEDISWEEFFGSSTDLMPCIMGAFDAIVETTAPSTGSRTTNSNGITICRRAGAYGEGGNFAHLSRNVQTILSHIPEAELLSHKRFASEESLLSNTVPNSGHLSRTHAAAAALATTTIDSTRPMVTLRRRSTTPPAKNAHHHHPNTPPTSGCASDDAGIRLSQNVHKMISNLPDNELLSVAARMTSSPPPTSSPPSPPPQPPPPPPPKRSNVSFLHTSSPNSSKTASSVVGSTRRNVKLTTPAASFLHNRVNSKLCEPQQQLQGQETPGLVRQPRHSYLYRSERQFKNRSNGCINDFTAQPDFEPHRHRQSSTMTTSILLTPGATMSLATSSSSSSSNTITTTTTSSSASLASSSCSSEAMVTVSRPVSLASLGSSCSSSSSSSTTPSCSNTNTAGHKSQRFAATNNATSSTGGGCSDTRRQRRRHRRRTLLQSLHTPDSNRFGDDEADSEEDDDDDDNEDDDDDDDEDDDDTTGAYLASAESLDSDPEPNGSQGSADSGIGVESQQSEEQHHQPATTTQTSNIVQPSPEARVLQEILDTEAVYVSDLGEVIQGYLLAWRVEGPTCPLYCHLDELFGNLEAIYDFNRDLLQRLRAVAGDCARTARVFIDSTADSAAFDVYTRYCCQHYPRTMDLLTRLSHDTEAWSVMRATQSTLGHALPLGAYLLKPVQRILKYQLLLQRLQKQIMDGGGGGGGGGGADANEDAVQAVELALRTMTQLASEINTMKRKHEHAVRVHELQSQLYDGWTGPELTSMGELIAEGTFRVNKARRRRHVLLFDKVFLMTKSKNGDGALTYKSHIMCSNLMLVEQVRGEPLSFQVLPFDNPRLQCTLRARSPQHKREWTLQIKRVILENYSAVIPNHARQLVMELGQDVRPEPQNDDILDKWSPLRTQHSTPHYLERRSHVRKSASAALGGSRHRTTSQDRHFPSLGSWRRKSDPSTFVSQYSLKTIPKIISGGGGGSSGGSRSISTPLKDSKNMANVTATTTTASSTFYTDFSDTEPDDEDEPQIEKNDASANANGLKQRSGYGESVAGRTDSAPESPNRMQHNLEQIVSDLLMQNRDFQAAMNRKRSIGGSGGGSGPLTVSPKNLTGEFLPHTAHERSGYGGGGEGCNGSTKSSGKSRTPSVGIHQVMSSPMLLASKADSLPRSFQLTSTSGTTNGDNTNPASSNDASLRKLVGSVDSVLLTSNYHTNNDSHMSASTSALLDCDQPQSAANVEEDSGVSPERSFVHSHPEHKIYRKSTIRMSLLQRFRSMLTSDEGHHHHHQRPVTSAMTASNCALDAPPLRKQGSKTMGEKLANQDYVDPYRLIHNIIHPHNGSVATKPRDVVSTIHSANVRDKGAKCTLNIAQQDQQYDLFNSANGRNMDDSQRHSDFYENRLEANLPEEYICVSDGDSGANGGVRLVAKQDSFTEKSTTADACATVPPPIPLKPARLAKRCSFGGGGPASVACAADVATGSSAASMGGTGSWVRAMVERFE